MLLAGTSAANTAVVAPNSDSAPRCSMVSWLASAPTLLGILPERWGHALGQYEGPCKAPFGRGLAYLTILTAPRLTSLGDERPSGGSWFPRCGSGLGGLLGACCRRPLDLACCTDADSVQCGIVLAPGPTGTAHWLLRRCLRRGVAARFVSRLPGRGAHDGTRGPRGGYPYLVEKPYWMATPWVLRDGLNCLVWGDCCGRYYPDTVQWEGPLANPAGDLLACP